MPSVSTFDTYDQLCGGKLREILQQSRDDKLSYEDLRIKLHDDYKIVRPPSADTLNRWYRLFCENGNAA